MHSGGSFSKQTLRVADILQTAADIVSQIGWTQGSYARDEDGCEVGERHHAAVCFCARGAIRLAAHLEEDSKSGTAEFDACVALNEYLILVGKDSSIVKWNDRRGRKAKEVSSIMYEAAEMIREQHK